VELWHLVHELATGIWMVGRTIPHKRTGLWWRQHILYGGIALKFIQFQDNINSAIKCVIIAVYANVSNDWYHHFRGACCLHHQETDCENFNFPTAVYIYRVSQEECARIQEGVPYAKLYWYNPKQLCPKLNGHGDNGQRKVWSTCGSTHCTSQLTILSISVLECGVIWRQFSSR